MRRSRSKDFIVPTPADRIHLALEILVEEWTPFIRQELSKSYGNRVEEVILAQIRGDRNMASARFSDPLSDPHILLNVVWEQWNHCFRHQLGIFERSLISELREFRNQLAHQSFLTEDDAYRVLDSVQRLLVATGHTQRATQLEDEKVDALRQKFGHRVNRELARIRFNRRRLLDIALYSLCCFALVTTLWSFLWERHWLATLLLIAFVIFTFGYFIYQRLSAAIPVFGVHECAHCRRVIYTESCPYCEQSPADRLRPRQNLAVQEASDATLAHEMLEMIDHPANPLELISKVPR